MSNERCETCHYWNNEICCNADSDNVTYPREADYGCRQYEPKTIRDQVGDPAMYMQLAEECTELAFACIKKTRILMGVNPTPCTAEAVDQSIAEEITDVVLCASELDLSIDNELMAQKRNRWRERLEECKA